MRWALGTFSLVLLIAGQIACSAETVDATPASRSLRSVWVPYCCDDGDLEKPRGCVREPSCAAPKLAIECRPDERCESGSVHCHCCRAVGTRSCVPSSRSARREQPTYPPPPAPSTAPTHRREGTIWSPF